MKHIDKYRQQLKKATIKKAIIKKTAIKMSAGKLKRIVLQTKRDKKNDYTKRGRSS